MQKWLPPLSLPLPQRATANPCLHRRSSRTHRSSPSCYGADCPGLAPSVHKTLSVPPRVGSLSPCWPPRPGALGLHAGEHDVGLRTRSCENRSDTLLFQSMGCPPGGHRIWLRCESTPPTVSCGFFFLFEYKISFGVGSRLFGRWLFST